MNEIRGLSIRQPWAWAVCAGLKRTENRTWSTGLRGTIAIHASAGAQVVNAIRRSSGCELVSTDRFDFGAIIGLADIADVTFYGIEHESDPFAGGPYCWTMVNGRFLREPIPFKGKLNLFKVDAIVQQQLRDAETFTLDLRDDGVAVAIGEAITPEPDPVQSYFELFQAYVAGQSDQEAAMVAGERLVHLAPDKPVGYYVRGSVKFDIGDKQGCVTDMLRAIELDQTLGLAWLALAGAYTDIDEHAKAIAAADQAVQLQPESFDACHCRVRARFFAKDYEKSLAECERGIRLAPDGFFPRTLRAEVLAAMGDRAGALEDLAEAERMAPGEPYIAETRQRLALDS